jgi:hypothetical protein
MSQYPIPPPSYGSTSPSPKSPNPPIYSGISYHDEPGSSAGIYNQPAPGDLPDDFKVCRPPFRLLDASFDPLDSMVSLLRKAPLKFDLHLSGKCTLSCVRLHILRLICTLSAWLILLSLVIVTQIVGTLDPSYTLRSGLIYLTA